MIELLTWFLWLGFVIVVHELGHLFVAVRLGYEADLNWSFKDFGCDVEGDITPKHDYFITAGGLLAGLIPLILASTIFTSYAWYALLVIYLVGAREDLALLMRGKRKC